MKIDTSPIINYIIAVFGLRLAWMNDNHSGGRAIFIIYGVPYDDWDLRNWIMKYKSVRIL